jgi:hypothetical protein
VKEGYHLEDPGVNERVILKWMFKEWIGVDCNDIFLDAGMNRRVL